MSALSHSESFKNFKSWVALQRSTVDFGEEKIWKYYDWGPKDVAPLILLGPASGTAEIWFRQFLSLCPKGYRLISVHFPAIFLHTDFCKGLDRFLDNLGIEKAHLLGTSLGGYLAQCYVQYRPQRILSLILCNSFADAQYYKDNAPCVEVFPFMPDFVLKRMILANFPTTKLAPEIADSVDFMVEQLEALKGSELASRLTLHCTTCPDYNAAELKLDNSKITIIDCLDEVAVPPKLRLDVYKFFPNAKTAEMRAGGNFPYLSKHEEFNLYLQVHLRNHSVASSTSVEGLFNKSQERVLEEIKEPSVERAKEESTTTMTTTTTTMTVNDDDVAEQ